jgi:hypothetical protein
LAGVVLATAAGAQVPRWLSRGERLTFTVSYLGLEAGTIVLEADQPQDDPGFWLAMRVTSSPFISHLATIDDKQVTLLDPVRFTTLSSHKRTREARYRVDEEIRFDPILGVARHWKDGSERASFPAPAPVLDTLAAIYFIRTLPLAPGRSFRMRVQSGDSVFPMEVAVIERREEETALGRLDVLVVEPRTAEGGLLLGKSGGAMWFTADTRHMLVYVAADLPFGSLKATLTRADWPWRRIGKPARE